MKKFLGIFAVFGAVLLLSGCGGSKADYVCTAKIEEDGQKAEVEFDVTLDNDEKVKSVDVTFEFDNEDYAKQMYAMFNMMNSFAEDESQKIDVSQSGKKVTIKNYEKISSQEDDDYDDDYDYGDDDYDTDEDSLGNIVGMTKEEFKKALEGMSSAADVSCK